MLEHGVLKSKLSKLGCGLTLNRFPIMRHFWRGIKKHPMQKLALLFCVALFFPLATLAHQLNPSTADVRFRVGVSDIEILTTLEAMIAGIDPLISNTADSENAVRYDTLRALEPDRLSEEFRKFLPQFLDGLHISVDGQDLEIMSISESIPPVGDPSSTRESVIRFNVEIPKGARQMVFGWDQKFGPVILRVSALNGQPAYSVYLQNGDVSAPFSVKDITPQSGASVFSNYIVIGYEHILPQGLDHILFVIGLFLLSVNIKSLLWQVSAFTAAHTISLALGMYGIVNVPPAIVEPLIAASIVYVGVENILLKELSRWRPVVVFMFGLLHGLGFASVLTDVGLPRSQFIEGLVGFNVGVEFGQLTVIGICFALVGIWFGKKHWYRDVITVPLSAGISLIAAYWFVQRAFL